MTDKRVPLDERITAYLTGGGLFNPELAIHDAVRDLLIDCRAALQSQPAAQGETPRTDAVCEELFHDNGPDDNPDVSCPESAAYRIATHARQLERELAPPAQTQDAQPEVRTELLPCPFCGGAPYVSTSPRKKLSQIRCSYCQYGFSTSEKWNRRACSTFRDEVCTIMGEHVDTEDSRILEGIAHLRQHYREPAHPQVAQPEAGRTENKNESILSKYTDHVINKLGGHDEAVLRANDLIRSGTLPRIESDELVISNPCPYCLENCHEKRIELQEQLTALRRD